MSLHRMMLRTITLLLLLPAAAPATPLGRSFTYQGELSQSGNPVDGTVTLRFSLWDAAGTGDPPTGGNPVGSSQIVTNVPVADGLFSVDVNGGGEFGTSAFSGEARWLQVEVCSDGSCTSTTVLGPRQPLTGTPYALGPWQLSGTNLSYTNGNVGIGTTTPTSRLDVRGGPVTVEGIGDQADLLWFATERTWVMRQEGTGSAAALKLQSVGGGGNKNFILQTTGFMGIGTTAPAAKLDVRGDIRLGPSGEFLAATGSENLRIIRGKISSTGSVISGSGFTASRIGTGIYSITFSPNYPSGQAPIITASAESNGSVARFAMVNGPTHIATWVRIVNGSGTAADADFYFIAAGAR